MQQRERQEGREAGTETRLTFNRSDTINSLVCPFSATRWPLLVSEAFFFPFVPHWDKETTSWNTLSFISTLSNVRDSAKVQPGAIGL